MSKQTFNDTEPSLNKISDYHRPMSAKKQRLIFITMGGGVVIAGLLYYFAGYLG